ncbi:GPI-GlcNAc transferase complex, PIG-H component-domain-containing protein [Pyronema domesticum]|uniref:Similar to Phosphatidylinositol N-acetylglucosaminyltransferase subunit gpi15 acc. no. Q9Y7L7 n=1 Tax=Pyronema omphalodes (strain CBS 100304) TaxID=1076935 RepID=U4L1G0_PYROM|nr:GPI-GlcNAc transferase complex, PIG-H component-domain-containing protein [Pyronema domesticum]CCX09687.1 Similar to Phosphatidylinositol N-acetylglucosaminyltransferase subunit gpi15; acc. no. Q9Y7L7 [Pyronema omphalodes CBS 100304]
MFTHPPTLQIRTPSPTTTEFIVTTRPPPSLSRTIVSVVVGSLRLVAFLTITTLLLSQHRLIPPWAALLQRDERLDPKWLYPISATVLWIIAQRSYTEESLLVIRSLGVQTSTTAGTLIGMGRKTRFIQTEKVRDVVINEGFYGMEVRFYLAVLVEGEAALSVVFPTLLPGRRICEQVWRGTRRCLYQGEKTKS